MKHEVDFEKWCPLCKYEKLDEEEDPCWYCLEEPANEDSTKPVEFVEKRTKNEV